MLSSANRKLFALRHLKKFGVRDQELVIIYTGYVRPVLEYAVPVSHSSLTTDQIKGWKVCRNMFVKSYWDKGIKDIPMPSPFLDFAH